MIAHDIAGVELPRWGDFAWEPEISRYPHLWKGLKGAWVPALGQSGDTVFDVSGHNNHGTNAGSWVIESQFGWGIDFGGTTNLNVPHKPHLDITGLLSIVFLVKGPTALGGNVRVLKKGVNGYNFYHLSDEKFALGRDSGFIKTDTIYDDGLWHMVVCTHDGTDGFSGLKIWVDGVDQATSTAGSFSGWDTTTNSVEISGDGTNYDGIISEVLIYDRLLTGSEIRQFFAEPYAPFLPLVSPSPTAVTVAAAGAAFIGHLPLLGVGR